MPHRFWMKRVAVCLSSFRIVLHHQIITLFVLSAQPEKSLITSEAIPRR
ncbi:MAG: hypothetical protein ACYCQJ_13290 [Nitrososphaerales archaeon]